MGAALTGAALWLQPRRAVALVAVMTAGLWCGWGLSIAPQLDGESSSRDLMREERELAGPGTEVGLVAWRAQTLLQAQGPTVAARKSVVKGKTGSVSVGHGVHRD